MNACMHDIGKPWACYGEAMEGCKDLLGNNLRATTFQHHPNRELVELLYGMLQGAYRENVEGNKGLTEASLGGKHS